MNSRERIFSALNREEPDRVPIVPWIGWYASIILGINLDDLARESMTYQPIPDTGYLRMWKFVLEAYKKLGVDMILPLNAWLLVAKTTTRESYRVTNHPRGILIQKTFDTPKGALTEEVLEEKVIISKIPIAAVATLPEKFVKPIANIIRGRPTRPVSNVDMIRKLIVVSFFSPDLMCLAYVGISFNIRVTSCLK